MMVSVTTSTAMSRPLPAQLRRSRRDHSYRAGDPSRAGLGLLGLLDRLDVLTLVRIAQLAPAIPGRGLRLERFDQIRGRLDLSLFRVERQGHLGRLSAPELLP